MTGGAARVGAGAMGQGVRNWRPTRPGLVAPPFSRRSVKKTTRTTGTKTTEELPVMTISPRPEDANILK